jgi:hypothetical protein
VRQEGGARVEKKVANGAIKESDFTEGHINIEDLTCPRFSPWHADLGSRDSVLELEAGANMEKSN